MDSDRLLTPEAFQAKLNGCIHCGMCLPACPTYRITGSEAESPRGRIYLMRALEENRLDSPQQLTTHLDQCLGCMGCMTACPSGVDYHSLLMSARQQHVHHQPRWKRRMRRWLLSTVLPNPTLLMVLAKAMQFTQRLGIIRWLKRQGAHYTWLRPWLQPLQFMPTIGEIEPLPTNRPVWGSNQKGRVALFVGCIMNTLYAQTHRNTIDVLVANGYQVVIPPQTCCGALAYHAGEMDIARMLAQKNMATLMQDVDWVVVNSAGCGSTLKDYHHVLSDWPGIQDFTEKVVDVVELLAKASLTVPHHTVPLKVAYHAACHLHHAQNIQTQPYTVLSQIPGIQLIPLMDAELCCGSAGVYNLAHPEQSLAILELKLEQLALANPDVIVTANPGCLLQLQTGLKNKGLDIPVCHPLDLLARAYFNRPMP